MDDPFIPQRGRRAMQFMHGGIHTHPNMVNMVERLAHNARQREQLTALGHQQQRALASGGYFLPMGRGARASGENGPGDD